MHKMVELSNGSYRVLEQIGHGASSKVYLVSKLSNKSKEDLHQLPTTTGYSPKAPMEENLQCLKLQNSMELRQFWSIDYIKEGQWHENNLANQKESIHSQIPLFCALKEIVIETGQMEQLKKDREFKTQLQILNRLSHPGILKILDWSVDEQGNSSYPYKLHMLTEWGSGGNLLTLIDVINEKKIFQQKKMRIFTHLSAQIVTIIEYLQNKGISHRDIKAENFILDDKYRLKLIDFGLAEIFDISKIHLADNKSRQVSKDESKKQHGYVGSKHYISPEMIERSRRDTSSQHYYSKTDIWSLGILIYYMFTRSYPFDGTNTFFVLQAIKKKDPDLTPIQDQRLRQLLQGMLQKRPEDRWEITRIKENQFFKDIQWHKIFEIESPLTELQKKQGQESLFYREEVVVKIEDDSKRRVVELLRRKVSKNSQKSTERQFQTSIKLNQRGELSMNDTFRETKLNIKSTNKVIQGREEIQQQPKQQIQDSEQNEARNYLTIGKPNSSAMFKYMELLGDTKLEVLKRVCRIIWTTQREGAQFHPPELQIQFKSEQQQQSFVDAFIHLSRR